LDTLFITSALNSAIAAVSMVLTVTHTGTGRTYGWLERLGDAAGLGEAALIAGSVASLGSSARPLVGRPYWPQFWLGVVGLGTVFPMILRKIERPHRSEPTAIHVVAHLSVLLGGLMLRWVTVRAGQESAEDPDAYFRFARGRQPFVSQPMGQDDAHRVVCRIKFVKGFERGHAPLLSGFHGVSC
jgi:formate-dependent nitrite reductase membrane component NrfD